MKAYKFSNLGKNLGSFPKVLEIGKGLQIFDQYIQLEFVESVPAHLETWPTGLG